MSRDNLLPFPRGETFWNGNGVSATDPAGQNVLGKVFRVEDTKYGSAGITLRVVQNLSGAALTGVNAGRGVRYTGAVTGLSRKVAGYVAAQGAYGVPIDDAYSGTTISANDIFYVVEEGYCKVKASLPTTASTTMSINSAFTWQAQGTIEPAAAGDHVGGRLVVALASGSTAGNRVLAQVGGVAANLM